MLLCATYIFISFEIVDNNWWKKTKEIIITSHNVNENKLKEILIYLEINDKLHHKQTTEQLNLLGKKSLFKISYQETVLKLLQNLQIKECDFVIATKHWTQSARNDVLFQARVLNVLNK